MPLAVNSIRYTLLDHGGGRQALSYHLDSRLRFEVVLRKMRRMILPERVLGSPGAH